MRKNVPCEVLLRFCEDSNVDPAWLLTGEVKARYVEIDGQKAYTMIASPETYELAERVKELTRERDEAQKEAEGLRRLKQLEMEMDAGARMEKAGYSAVPVYDMESEGEVEHDPETERKGIREIVLKTAGIKSELKTDPRSLAIFRISGDFMEPTLKQGDLVVRSVTD